MDENDLAKAGMEVMLKPVTDIAENVLGLVGGDWLSEKRARNRAKLKAKTEEILKKRGAELDDDPSPTVIAPLLSAAQDEGREELQDLWARLLASAMDPKRRAGYRRQFVGIVKELEPVDALIFRSIAQMTGSHRPSRMHHIMEKHKLSQDEVQISFYHLAELDLLTALNNGAPDHTPGATGLGRVFMKAIED